MKRQEKTAKPHKAFQIPRPWPWIFIIYSVMFFSIVFIVSDISADPQQTQKKSTAKVTAKRGIQKTSSYEGMVLVPAGEFKMGTNRPVIRRADGAEDPDLEVKRSDHKLHTVYLDSYYIDKFEVTNKQYAEFLNAYGKDTDDKGQKMIYEDVMGLRKVNGKWQPVEGYEYHPVIDVTWYGAGEYAKYYGKRLPTEAEWEKACNCGRLNSRYCFGNDEKVLGDYAWYVSNAEGETHFVGDKKPNSLGVYDMHGNVSEWCSDWYDAGYYTKSSYNNPRGPTTGEGKVCRGGSWSNNSNGCITVARESGNPESSDDRTGFRCACSAGQ